MEIDEVVNELCVFASSYRSFTLTELTDFPVDSIDVQLLKSTLLSDSRFICLQSEPPDENRLVLDSTLFNWFIRLNMRLAEIGKFRLTENHIACRINSLRREGRWKVVPSNAMTWGISLGLICPTFSSDQYNFPIAHFFSKLTSSRLQIADNVLKEMCIERIWAKPLRKRIKKALTEGFSRFNKNVEYVVRCREGLLTGKRMTLQEVGDTMSLTRERVRQVEEKFWMALRKTQWHRGPFMFAFLCYLMNVSGSFMVRLGSYDENLVTFLAKCFDIPFIKFQKLGILLLSFSTHDNIASLSSARYSLDEIEQDSIIRYFEFEDKTPLLKRDIKELAKRTAYFRQKHLNTSQKVYLALRSIGRPAHYSKVTEIHNEMWPEGMENEHSIHAALGRGNYGVVWLGIRGTYALKEWGYDRPLMGFYESVAKIVRNKYEETGVPVSFSVISSEIGKYRKMIKSSSLILSLVFNPQLQRVQGDCFIPRDPNYVMEDSISSDELDRILRQFQTNK